MKTKPTILFAAVMAFGFFSCSQESQTEKKDSAEASTVNGPGQSAVKDETSAPNIVQVASKSPDHTTLVAAVQAAGLVDALSNAGPFTVFAPTNDAFAKLPAGTVEGLLKPEKQADLKNVLEYHTYVGSLKTDYMQDGQEFEQVSGGKIKITKKDGKVYVNETAEIVASIPTSNGIIHVINTVLLPK